MGKMGIETQGHRGLGRAQERLHDDIDSYYVVGVTAKQHPRRQNAVWIRLAPLLVETISNQK